MQIEKMQQLWQTQEAVAPLPARFHSLKSKLQLFEFEQGKTSARVGMWVLIVLGLVTGLVAFQKNSLLFWAVSLAFFARAWQLAEQARVASGLPDATQDPLGYLTTYLQLVKQVQRAKQRMVIPGLIYVTIVTADLFQGGPVELEEVLVTGAFGGIALLLFGVLLWWYRYEHPYSTAKLQEELEALIQDWSEAPEE